MLKNALWLFVTTIGVFLLFLPSYSRMQDLAQRNHEYDQEVVRLTAKREELHEELKRLQEDPAYLEKVARDKMGLIKEGEVVYQILPPESENIKAGQQKDPDLEDSIE